MRENSRYLGNWLHQKALMLPSTMTEEDVTTGEIRHSSSTTESLCFVKRFWQQTWNRSADKAIAAAKNLEKQAPEVPPCAFSITAHDLYATAQRRKQGSAGPDGWMQAELASLPVQHWHDVIDLLQRWQRRNRYPRLLATCPHGRHSQRRHGQAGRTCYESHQTYHDLRLPLQDRDDGPLPVIQGA